MARDYRKTIAGLRRKAADPATPEPERKALTKRADEMAKRHNVSEDSPLTYDTTVTSRDGFTYQPPPNGFANMSDFMAWLLANQWRWNEEYTNPDGTPKPQKPAYTGPDPASFVEDEYAYEEDEDYGYDLFEGDEY